MLTRPARRKDRAALARLLQLYQYEFSTMLPAEPDSRGRFRVIGISGRDRRNFLIRVRGRIAGFASVRLGSVEPSVRGAEFDELFVLRRHQRRGVGWRAAREIFRRYPGEWRVAELRVNRPAIRFWHEVIRGVAAGRQFRERRVGGIVIQRFRTT